MSPTRTTMRRYTRYGTLHPIRRGAMPTDRVQHTRTQDKMRTPRGGGARPDNESTRRMDKLVKTLGITGLSKSQVSRMATDLDEHVDQFRNRPLHDAGPFTFVAADALTMKVREGGRVVSCAVLVATGVNNDGHREVLGVRVSTSETAPAWKEFFADLVARGLTGVRLVTSDAHLGLVEAAANLPGATWQRCRTHYAANLMSVTPKALWPAVKAMLHSVQPARRRIGQRSIRPALGLRARQAPRRV